MTNTELLGSLWRVVPGVMSRGPGLCIMSHVLFLPPIYRWRNQGLKGQDLKPRGVLNQKPDGGGIGYLFNGGVGSQPCSRLCAPSRVLLTKLSENLGW